MSLQDCSEIFDLSLPSIFTIQQQARFIMYSYYEMGFIFSLHFISSNSIVSLRLYMVCEGKVGSETQNTDKTAIPSILCIFLKKAKFKNMYV